MLTTFRTLLRGALRDRVSLFFAVVFPIGFLLVLGFVFPDPGYRRQLLAGMLAVSTLFFSLTPCRIVDTGGAPGPSGGPAMAANSTRMFPAAGLCGIPTTAKAIAVIVTTAEQTDFGDLRVYHGDGAVPASSTINFAANHARANNAIVPLGTAGRIQVTCDMPPGSSGTTRLIVDVYGYFE